MLTVLVVCRLALVCGGGQEEGAREKRGTGSAWETEKDRVGSGRNGRGNLHNIVHYFSI